MNLTRRTLAKVAAMLTLSGSIPAIAKTTAKVENTFGDFLNDPVDYNGDHIGLMHYVEPNTLFNGDMKRPYGYWATSYVDDLLEIPQWGDTFSHWPDLGTDDIPTPSQQLKINVASYQAAMHDMMTEFCYGERRYIRHREGSMMNLGRDHVYERAKPCRS